MECPFITDELSIRLQFSPSRDPEFNIMELGLLGFWLAGKLGGTQCPLMEHYKRDVSVMSLQFTFIFNLINQTEALLDQLVAISSGLLVAISAFQPSVMFCPGKRRTGIQLETES